MYIKGRHGFILSEWLVALTIFSAILSGSYQMLAVLQHESQQLMMLTRQREQMDLIFRIKNLAPKMNDVVVKTWWIRFKNMTKDQCDIFRDGQRLIYQKNGRGYYVLCTRVKTVWFQQTTHHTITVHIDFLDGSKIDVELLNQITGIIS